VPFELWSVVVVPFPFVDPWASRLRPALVVSEPRSLGNLAGLSVLVMITSATHSPWPLDVSITDLASAGLPAPAIVRMKLFTLDDRLVERTAGALAPPDSAAVAASLARLIGGSVPASPASLPVAEAQTPPRAPTRTRRRSHPGSRRQA